MTFGERLRIARENAGLTQGALAELCGWTDGQSRIANYEANTREPTLSDITKLSKHVRVAREVLAFGSNDMTQAELDLIQAWRLADTGLRAAFESLCALTRKPKRRKPPIIAPNHQ